MDVQKNRRANVTYNLWDRNPITADYAGLAKIQGSGGSTRSPTPTRG